MMKRIGLIALLSLALTACGTPTALRAASAHAIPLDVRLLTGIKNPVIVGSDTIHVPVGGSITVHPGNGAARAATKHGKLELTGPRLNVVGLPRVSPRPSLTLRFPKPGGYYAYLVVNPRNATTSNAWGYRRLTVLVGAHVAPPKAPPWLGIFITTDSSRVAKTYDLKAHYGVLIDYVDPHSPAQQAGLKAGEVIYLVADRHGDHLISTASQLQRIISADSVGQRITLALVRRWGSETPSDELNKTMRLALYPITSPAVPASVTIPMPPAPKPHATVTFGAGFDHASFSLTGTSTAFSTSAEVHWLLTDPSAFGTTSLGLQLYQVQGATEQLVNTTPITLDPQSNEEEDTVNQYLAPGTYQLLFITHNKVLASGTFTIR